jgi:hypothetical protein
VYKTASPEDEAWGRAAATEVRAEIDQNEPQFLTEAFPKICKYWNRQQCTCCLGEKTPSLPSSQGYFKLVFFLRHFDFVLNSQLSTWVSLHAPFVWQIQFGLGADSDQHIIVKQ